VYYSMCIDMHVSCAGLASAVLDVDVYICRVALFLHPGYGVEHIAVAWSCVHGAVV
jgi:hypothetical protein